MSKQMTLVEIALVAAATKNAYSYERYEDWTNCVLALAIEGYTAKQATWVLRSKLMRWAGDNSENDYGHITANDMLKFLNDYGKDRVLSDMREPA